MFDEFKPDPPATRDLQEPDSLIEGGGNLDDNRLFKPAGEVTVDDLREYARIYKSGGAVKTLIDTRALMTFGTGVEFAVDGAGATATTAEGETLTADDWLADAFGNLDDLLIKLGKSAYVFGRSFGEIISDGGAFEGVVTVPSQTIEVKHDDRGQVQRYEQIVKGEGRDEVAQTFQPDEIAHFTLGGLGREPNGVSLIASAEDEVQQYRQNQRSISAALESHAFTKWWVQVGSEGGQVIDDVTIRRIADRFRNIKNDDTYVTGSDLEINELDEGALGESITDIAEHDLRLLANAFGVPPEFVGLMTSTEALSKTNLQRFETQARAEQRELADQFVAQVVRPVLRNFSPFPEDLGVTLQFGDPTADQAQTAEWLMNFKDTFTRDEIRERLDAGPVPAEADLEGDEAPAAGEGGQEAGGLFDGGLSGESEPRAALSDGGLTTAEEDVWMELWDHAIATDETDRRLFQFDPEEVPQFVKERIRGAILSGATFSQFETVPDEDLMALRQTLADSLEEQHGWSIDSLRDNLTETVDELSKDEAERIARTETQAIVNQARETGYEQRLDMDEAQFKWINPQDHRTTEVCDWLVEQTQDGVTMERMKELIDEGNRRFVDHQGREFTPHINCRSTYVRVVE